MSDHENDEQDGEDESEFEFPTIPCSCDKHEYTGRLGYHYLHELPPASEITFFVCPWAMAVMSASCTFSLLGLAGQEELPTSALAIREASRKLKAMLRKDASGELMPRQERDGNVKIELELIEIAMVEWAVANARNHMAAFAEWADEHCGGNKFTDTSVTQRRVTLERNVAHAHEHVMDVCQQLSQEAEAEEHKVLQ